MYLNLPGDEHFLHQIIPFTCDQMYFNGSASLCEKRQDKWTSSWSIILALGIIAQSIESQGTADPVWTGKNHQILVWSSYTSVTWHDLLNFWKMNALFALFRSTLEGEKEKQKVVSYICSLSSNQAKITRHNHRSKSHHVTLSYCNHIWCILMMEIIWEPSFTFTHFLPHPIFKNEISSILFNKLYHTIDSTSQNICCNWSWQVSRLHIARWEYSFFPLFLDFAFIHVSNWNKNTIHAKFIQIAGKYAR